jgi:hypothetical protein
VLKACDRLHAAVGVPPTGDTTADYPWGVAAQFLTESGDSQLAAKGMAIAAALRDKRYGDASSHGSEASDYCRDTVHAPPDP